MRCQSGKHEWTDPTSAERCCSGKWHRAHRSIEDADDLDEEGRVYQGCGMIAGWVRLPEDVMA